MTQSELSALVAQLDSQDIQTRERATEMLAMSRFLTTRDIERLLEDDRLSPEQRARLVTAAGAHFFNEPRAAIGVRWDIDFRESIVIVETIAGFDSDSKLESGDLVRSANGIPLDCFGAQNLFRYIIVSHDPGDTLDLSVRRGAGLVELEVVLGEYKDLNQSLSPAQLVAAWNIRRAGLIARDEPIALPGGEDVPWSPKDATSRIVTAQRSVERAPGVVAGGIARPARLLEIDDADRLEARLQLQLARGGLAPRDPWVPGEQLSLQPRDLGDDLERVERSISLIQSQLAGEDPDERAEPGQVVRRPGGGRFINPAFDERPPLVQLSYYKKLRAAFLAEIADAAPAQDENDKQASADEIAPHAAID